MACLSPDGNLTSSARELLKALSEPLSPEEIASRIGNPLFRVRASLREMKEAGLVIDGEGGYMATQEGKAAIGAD